MILLDTNVISAVMRTPPDDVVVAWLDRQPVESVWTTAITLFEIEFGLHRLPRGRRRTQLTSAFRTMIRDDLQDRVLPFDAAAAEQAAQLSADLQSKGQAIEIRDVQIAGIARAHRAMVATGNVRHFDRMCTVRNPWQDD